MMNWPFGSVTNQDPPGLGSGVVVPHVLHCSFDNDLTRCLVSPTPTTSWTRTLILVVLFRVLSSYWLWPSVLVLYAPIQCLPVGGGPLPRPNTLGPRS